MSSGRFLVFGHSQYYPNTADRDFIGRSDNPENLIAGRWDDWYAILDLETMRWEVREGPTLADYRPGFRPT